MDPNDTRKFPEELCDLKGLLKLLQKKARHYAHLHHVDVLDYTKICTSFICADVNFSFPLIEIQRACVSNVQSGDEELGKGRDHTCGAALLSDTRHSEGTEERD